jgi:hypothetical protein
MKNTIPKLSVVGMCVFLGNGTLKEVDFEQYLSTVISNDEVQLKVYLPDSENGLYRATRFDWSGVIGSVQYKGHEYFGYWKETHDPLFHEDLSGPVEGYIEPGLGYAEAEPGGGLYIKRPLSSKAMAFPSSTSCKTLARNSSKRINSITTSS